MNTPREWAARRPAPESPAPAAPRAAPSLVAARERAIQLLTDRYAERAVDDAELESRLARLHGAADAAGVEAAMRDLGAPSATPVERRMLAVLGEVRRVGRWAVPRLLRVRALFGEVKVDLRDNPIPDGFTLDVRALGSRVTLIVPPDVPVAFDVFAIVGNAISQADEPAPHPAAAPPIRVRGSAFLGEVRVLVRERGA